MKKKILVLTLCIMTLIAPVYAQNENAGSNNSNSAKAAEKVKTAAEKKLEARALKVTIKANINKLHQLRLELKTKLQEKKALIEKYKEQEELTEEQKLEVKNMIQEFKDIRSNFTNIRNNAMKNLKEYKGDNSENKLTGLNLVIKGQQERIKLLQECIDKLS